MQLIKKIIELLKSLFFKSDDGETVNVVQLSDNSGKTENTAESNSEATEPKISDNIGQQQDWEIEFGETIVEHMEDILLELKRIYTCSTYTIGHLFINGEYFCDTIEDADRGLTDKMSLSEIKAKKIYGETAIPTGTYEITMREKSAKFQSKEPYKNYGGYIPRLINVKGYDGVLIHIGNYAADSLGCILVGKNKAKGTVLESTATFKLLMDKYMIPAKEKGVKFSIKITSEY